MNNIKRKSLSVFSLVMINVIAIDSLRNLPINAKYGFCIVFFYIIAAIFFLIPCALITAELATQWPKTGGSYIWVREAFGKRWGFMNIWLQWIYNVVWYPTILTFVATTIAFLFAPHLIHSKAYMVSMILIMFIGASLLNAFGMRISSLISEIGAIAGTMFPMCVIIILGIAWFIGGHSARIPMHFGNLFPHLHSVDNLSFLIVVMFSLIGVEMSAIHAEEVKNPARDYPRALLISCVIIIASLILASLAIAVVVPNTQLNLVNGLNQAFANFFASYGIHWAQPVIEILIIIGGFAGMATWIIGPTKGLLVAAKDRSLPKMFGKVNKHNAPVPVLILQAIIVIVLTGTFVLLPTVSSAYWFLSVLTAQLALIYYVIMFAAGIRLRYKYPDREKTAYLIPGGKFGLWLTGILGLTACITGIAIGFLPPSGVKIGSLFNYETMLIIGILIFMVTPLIIYQYCNKPEKT